jgi:hypothetical protein
LFNYILWVKNIILLLLKTYNDYFTKIKFNIWLKTILMNDNGERFIKFISQTFLKENNLINQLFKILIYKKIFYFSLKFVFLIFFNCILLNQNFL